MKLLIWIWHSNEWRLAQKITSNGRLRYMLVTLQEGPSDVSEWQAIEGPQAGTIYPHPRTMPTYRSANAVNPQPSETPEGSANIKGETD